MIIFSKVSKTEPIERIAVNSYGLSSNEMEQIITSMKLPDAKVNKLHVDNDYHGKILTNLYDIEDIRRAQELVGFKAAFPRNLPGDFAARGSYVSRKVNFNHVENDEDSKRKLFNVTYSRGDRNQKNKADSGIRDVSFKQMLNGNMKDASHERLFFLPKTKTWNI